MGVSNLKTSTYHTFSRYGRSITMALGREEKVLLDEIMWVEERAWAPEVRASRNKMLMRLETFPEGIAFVLSEGKIVGVSTALIINYDPSDPPRSWEEATGDGFIQNHTPRGNCYYIASVGVAKDYQGKGLGDRLLRQQKGVARGLGLQYVVLGSRVPTAHLRPDAQIEEVIETDPQIAFYKRNGFRPVKIRENYMEDDPESRNYGVVMEWKVE